MRAALEISANNTLEKGRAKSPLVVVVVVLIPAALRVPRGAAAAKCLPEEFQSSTPQPYTHTLCPKAVPWLCA